MLPEAVMASRKSFNLGFYANGLIFSLVSLMEHYLTVKAVSDVLALILRQVK